MSGFVVIEVIGVYEIFGMEKVFLDWIMINVYFFKVNLYGIFY